MTRSRFPDGLVVWAVVLGVAGLGLGTLAGVTTSAEDDGATTPAAAASSVGSAAAAPAALPPDELVVAVPIRPGDAWGVLMSRYGLPERPLREAAADLYDLTRIRPDRELQVGYRDGTDAPTEVRYQLDEDRTVVVARQDAATDGTDDTAWGARIDEVQYETTPVVYGFGISSSLWNAAREAGLRDADVIELAQVFEYVVDFNTEVQQGDRFSLYGELRTAPGREPTLGTLHAVRYATEDRTLEAVRFRREGRGPEGTDEESWHLPDGKALARQFLRSPLEFGRVTSRFNPGRFHPILKTRRPHNGTDFGAPRGTPVRAVASGVVIRAGRNGGHGNYVEIRHDDTWRTSYSHLSAILVRRGERVSQGEYVGKVGSTGMSTGPHLHYQMWKNDRYVDAMRVELPYAEPLDATEMPAFLARAEEVLPRLPAADFLGREIVGSPADAAP